MGAGGELADMCFLFLFRVCFHRRFWLACGMALGLGADEGRAVAQDVFAPSSPTSPPASSASAPSVQEVDAAAGRKAPQWDERGLRAALADPSLEVHWHAVNYITQKGWVTRFLSLKDVRPMLQSPQAYIQNKGLAALAQLGPEAAPCAGEILPLLKDEAYWRRALAVDALGQMGREAVPHAKDIVPLLRDEEKSVREAAVQALGNLGQVAAPAVVPLIQPLLAELVSRAERDAALTVTAPRSADPFGPAAPAPPTYDGFLKKRYVRRCAVQALAGMGAAGAPLAVPILQPLLKDGDEDIRSEAQRALESLTKATPESVAQALEKSAEVPAAPTASHAPPPEEYLSSLISQLRAPDEATRSAAAKALAEAAADTPPQVMSGLLLPLLKDSQYFVVCSAAAALQKAGREHAAACRHALLPLLKSADADTRRLAIETLKVGDASAESAAVVLPALLPLVQDPERQVKFQAADVFHQWGVVAAPYAKDFLPLINDSGDYVRVCAIHALAGGAGMNDADTVVAAVVAVLPKCSSSELSSAVHDLRHMAQNHVPAATAALLHLLKDPNSSVRSHAAQALGKLGEGTPTHLQVLLPLLKDSSSMVRYHALMAIHEMGPEAELALAPELVPLLQHPGGPMQPTEVEPDGWGGIGVSAAELPLRVVADLYKAGHGAEPAAFQALLAVLRQTTVEYEREDAARLLRCTAEQIPTYAKDLLPLLQDKNPSVQSQALSALEATPPKDVPMVARAIMPLLQQTEGDVKYALVTTLGKMGPAAVPVALPALLALVKDPDPTVRVRLAFAMGDMGAAAAPWAADLLPLLQAPEGVVKSRAVGALADMGPQAIPVLVQALPQLFRDEEEKPEGMDMYDITLRSDVYDALEKLGKTAAPELVQALLPLLRHPDSTVRFSVLDSLDTLGPFIQSLDWHCAALATALGFPKDEDAQELRFHLYLWSGHDPDLLLSVRWLGKPTANPMPAKGAALSAEDQQAVLGMLLRLWPHSAPHPTLRREMTRRIGDVAQSITTAPDEKVAALLKSLDDSLKADVAMESKESSAKARAAVEKALQRGKSKK